MGSLMSRDGALVVRVGSRGEELNQRHGLGVVTNKTLPTTPGRVCGGLRSLPGEATYSRRWVGTQKEEPRGRRKPSVKWSRVDGEFQKEKDDIQSNV